MESKDGQAGKNNLTFTLSNFFVNKKGKNINMIKGVEEINGINRDKRGNCG